MSLDHLNARIAPWRISLALLPGVFLCGYVAVSVEPFPQPQSYHQFADDRLIFKSIPHAGDVLTNLAFILVGATGMWFILQQKHWTRAFAVPQERWSYLLLFIGTFLTGFGSGWYHLSPNNETLVWDRLPMILGFMGVFSAMLSERIYRPLGYSLVAPLVAIGIGSVLWWIWTEHQGNGDLRWYLVAQFYPLLTMALMLTLLPSRYTRGNDYWLLFIFYTLAKIVEVYDKPIYALTNETLSGHSLKHLFAATGVAVIIRMLWKRRPINSSL